ncbi:MAG: glycosyltransferase [Anaerolineae bacterium]|jgi:rhamnosyl/mannosyltransferase|nr:glycosyltransferase [Anaerolineae bacterium]
MKILHVYKDYFPILGGIENHVRNLAEGQAQCGHQVTALVTHPDSLRTNVAVEDGVRIIRAGRLATVASTPLSLALPWQLLREQPDVVHLHFPYPVGEVSQWLLRRGRATVLSYHSDIVRQAGILRFYRPLLLRVLAAVDAILIGSPPMAGSAYLAAHQAKLHLIPYGIPLARFKTRPTADELARVRQSYLPQPAASASAELPLLLFVGRLRYYKGLDYLIRALPEIPARLLVIGVGPMEAEWKALAEACGVSDRIVWGGEAPDADLPALYHLADLFVLPASHSSEAFGLVQVEAMAAGVPVVCTELGTGTSYVNQDGVTGRVAPPRDPAALAAAISELLADPSARTAMSAAARARVEAEFEQSVMVARVLATYQKLVV